MTASGGATSQPSLRTRTVLIGASGGGHWIELLRLRPAFAGFGIAYVSTFESYAQLVAPQRYYAVPDASRFRVRTFLPIFARAARILWRERPYAVVTTGSAPMLPFIVLGRLFGAKTLWIDSIANSEHMSTSGRIARRIAHRCIAQWPDVALEEGIECWGKIV